MEDRKAHSLARSRPKPRFAYTPHPRAGDGGGEGSDQPFATPRNATQPDATLSQNLKKRTHRPAQLSPPHTHPLRPPILPHPFSHPLPPSPPNQIHMQTTAINNSGKQGTQMKNKSMDLKAQDFIKMMVTQLQNQDPMEPAKNSELLAQMSQIGQLQSSTSLNESLKSMVLQT